MKNIARYIQSNLSGDYLVDHRLAKINLENMSKDDMEILCDSIDYQAMPVNISMEWDRDESEVSEVMKLYEACIHEILEICDENDWQLPIFYNVDIWS